MKKIVRINMNNLSVVYEDVPPAYEMLGGRILINRIMLDEVPPYCNPLGKHNKLILTPGLLGGTNISSSGRISIGGKGPLTGTIKESNGGGLTGLKLARLGIKALIIEGKPSETVCYMIIINKRGCELIPVPEFRGVGVYRTAKDLTIRLGKKVGMALIGPAGENLMAVAGIANTDKDGNPTRYCGRGGLGALMGSKGIKAIVIDDRETSNLPVADSDKMKDAISKYNRLIKESPVIEAYTKYGTAGMVTITNALGCLPTRNFTRGRFKGADRIDGEALYNLINTRKGKGKTTHSCMPGCIIGCSNVFPDKKGDALVSPLEYETIGLFGANLEIDDLDTIAWCNFLCNDYGIDTIETAQAIAVAMQAGVLQFSDYNRVAEVVTEIGQCKTLLGRVLGQGAVIAGRVLGVLNVPAVKGQSMAAYDPRGVKGMGVTYSMSPMGADHTYGTTVRAKIDQLNPRGQVELSQRVQLTIPAYDNLGLCMFVSVALGAHPQVLADLVNACYGWQWSTDSMLQLSKDTILMEREFNRCAGFADAHDRLPEFFYEQSLPDTNSVFDVPQEEIKNCYDF